MKFKRKDAERININIFRKPYAVRRFGVQNIVGGYPEAGYSDFKAFLNVQPLSNHDLQSLPEGERTVKRIKSYGADMLQSSDENTGVSGDRLYYRGYWYECKSSAPWGYNLFSLSHFESMFVILPPDKQKEMGAPL